jgi:uncharacterized protein with PQ loop repeat
VAENRKKKVVRVESDAAEIEEAAADWKPAPEAKGKATTFRVIAAILWILAIGTEVFAILFVLRQEPVNLVLLIILLVVIGALALGGSLLWKRANRLDPARRSDKARFFIQNQLGAIITVIAFLPLIILIFTNKNMDGKQKGIAGAIAIVLLLVAGYFGTTINPPSVEQYTEETATVVELTGQNLVFWTKSGEVYHLCEDASAVNLESEDNTIYSGTVADAHADGKERLTLQVEQELEQCGFAPEEG